jgi:hypothetical protein
LKKASRVWFSKRKQNKNLPACISNSLRAKWGMNLPLFVNEQTFGQPHEAVLVDALQGVGGHRLVLSSF